MVMSTQWRTKQKVATWEQKYSTIEKECLAIKLGVSVFRIYLLGRPFRIETDHRSLVWIKRLKHTNMDTQLQ